MTQLDRGTDRRGRRSKRLLSQRYEIWLRLIRQEVTIAEAAEQQQVDRSTIMRIRTVAKESALAALAASKPGVRVRERDYELEAAKAEVARLSEAVRQMAVKLTLVVGSTRASDTSAQTTNTKDEVKPAARSTHPGARRCWLIKRQSAS